MEEYRQKLHPIESNEWRGVSNLDKHKYKYVDRENYRIPRGGVSSRSSRTTTNQYSKEDRDASSRGGQTSRGNDGGNRYYEGHKETGREGGGNYENYSRSSRYSAVPNSQNKSTKSSQRKGWVFADVEKKEDGKVNQQENVRGHRFDENLHHQMYKSVNTETKETKTRKKNG